LKIRNNDIINEKVDAIAIPAS